MSTEIKKVKGEYLANTGGKKYRIGKTIALLYDYVSNGDRRIRGTFHKFGKVSDVKKYYLAHKERVDSHPDEFKGTQVCMHTLSNVDPLFIQRMIDTTGFVGIWHEAFVLGKPEAISRMYKIKFCGQ